MAQCYAYVSVPHPGPPCLWKMLTIQYPPPLYRHGEPRQTLCCYHAFILKVSDYSQYSACGDSSKILIHLTYQQLFLCTHSKPVQHQQRAEHKFTHNENNQHTNHLGEVAANYVCLIAIGCCIFKVFL